VIESGSLVYTLCVQVSHTGGKSKAVLHGFLGHVTNDRFCAPKSNGFMTDFDASFMQHVFDIAKGEWKPDIEHNRKTDDLGTGFEVSKWARFDNRQTLRNRPDSLNQVFL